MPSCPGMKALLVIGIHREERAFGEAVAAGLKRERLDVLAIEDGLSGRRPRTDQRFRYDTLHRALYSQLPAHMTGHYDLLIDLHTGLDREGFSADLICARPEQLAGIEQQLGPDARRVRLVRLGSADMDGPSAKTVIPESVWRNPYFLYVGIEIFLPESGAGTLEEHVTARRLVEGVVECTAQHFKPLPYR